MCDNPEYTPFLQLMKPAEVKINPYTNQPMSPSPVQYSDNQVTLPKVKSYILSNLPDYSVSIDGLPKLTEFRDVKND